MFAQETLPFTGLGGQMYTPCRSRRFGLVPIGSFIYLIFSSSGIIFHCLPTPSPPPSQACAPHFLAAARATVPGQDDEKAIFHPTLSLLFSKLSTSALPPTPTEQLVRWCWMVGGQTVGRYFIAVWGAAAQVGVVIITQQQCSTYFTTPAIWTII